MIEIAKGHWGGDPRVHCGRLVLRAKTQRDAKKLALLNRLLDDPETAEMLFDACHGIEAARDAALDPAFA
jgi:hypothetical protein